MNWVKSAVTGKDNESVDIGRVALVLGCLAYLCFEGYIVDKTGVFDMINFSLGYGGLLGAGSGALYLKKSTEPDERQKDGQGRNEAANNPK